MVLTTQLSAQMHHHATLNVLLNTTPITVIMLIVIISCDVCITQTSAGHQNVLVPLTKRVLN
jgi:hypothetical protein